ncbi:MAG: CARDB domain-containing protein, partial [Candidatus Hermodarchaeota archaeon]
TDSYDDPAWFTNYGPGIDVAAPGVDIYSTIPVSMGSYGYMSGTSMACPHVAGVVALIRAENPAWTNDYVRNHLRNSADDLGPPGWDDYYGYGRVNAYYAVQPPPEHELIAYLDAPTAILPSTSYDLGVMVGNWGQNDETDVTLQLWIDDVMVDSETYPSLLVGTTENFTYTWTPSIEGTYNITTYAVPVSGETFIDNNQATQFVLVTNSIIDYDIGDFIQMDDANSGSMWANFTYEYDIDPTHVYTSFGDGFSWFSVNKLTRQIEDGNLWVGMYHIAQIETNIGLSDTINWFSTTGTVTGTVWYDWAGMPLEAWNVTIAWDDTFAYYHKATGIWLYYQEWTGFQLNMENTSMITWVPPAHDVVASIEAPGILPPGETTTLNASVYNRGTSDETGVTLQLWIDDVMVDSSTYPSLPSGATETLSYPWTPMTIDTYNITAYVVPVSGETYINNNKETKMVLVKDPGEVAILQDAYPWDYDWTGILDTNGITYDIFDSTNFGSIDLSIYSRVIIPSDQPQAFYDAVNSHLMWLETYVSDGGILDLHAADSGWNGGSWVGVLPAGFTYHRSSQDAVDIVDPTHLILHYPHEITDEELDGWSSSVHGYLGNIGPSHVVLTTTSSDPVLIEVASGLGYYIITTQTLEWAYSGGYSPMLENVLLYNPIPPDHDLMVYLEAPTFVAPGTSVTLNTTVTNRGIYDESNVELQLLIDEVVVASDTYTLLEGGNSETISYVWTPLTVGTYNITAYVVPVLDESTLNNNVHTKMTLVTILQNYDMVVDAPYTWYDAYINGYSLGLIGDDESASVDFPFSFNYYDASFSTVYVSSNGWLSFDNTDPWQYSNPPFPTFDYPYAVAPFWNDLYADDNVYVWTTAEFVVIEYYEYYHLGGDLAGTFEVVFFATGEILFQYQSITYDYGSTVGLNYGLNTDFYNAYTGGLDGITDFALLFTTNSAPTVTVTYPNGGETLSGTVTITWTASDPDSDFLTFDIYCWNWDESTWDEIVVGHSTTSYEWDTTTVSDGEYHKIRVVASDGELTGEDTSDAVFTIDNPSAPLVTVTSPNGGETLSGTVTITWTAADPDGDSLTFTVYYWDGSTWVELANGLTTTSYDWDTTTVPDGSNYEIRVRASDGIFTAGDESDAPFTIDNAPSTTTTTTTITTSTTSTTTTTIPGFEAILALLIFLSLGLTVLLRGRKRSQAK